MIKLEKITNKTRGPYRRSTAVNFNQSWGVVNIPTVRLIRSDVNSCRGTNRAHRPTAPGHRLPATPASIPDTRLAVAAPGDLGNVTQGAPKEPPRRPQGAPLARYKMLQAGEVPPLKKLVISTITGTRVGHDPCCGRSSSSLGKCRLIQVSQHRSNAVLTVEAVVLMAVVVDGASVKDRERTVTETRCLWRHFYCTPIVFLEI